MNTTVIPSGCDGKWNIETISNLHAKIFLDNCSKEEIVSTVGHESTAQIMSTLLDREVPINRIQAQPQPGDYLICFKLNKRAPEGVILTVEQIEEIGYHWVAMYYEGKEIHDVAASDVYDIDRANSALSVAAGIASDWVAENCGASSLPWSMDPENRALIGLLD